MIARIPLTIKVTLILASVGWVGWLGTIVWAASSERTSVIKDVESAQKLSKENKDYLAALAVRVGALEASAAATRTDVGWIRQALSDAGYKPDDDSKRKPTGP